MHKIVNQMDKYRDQIKELTGSIEIDCCSKLMFAYQFDDVCNNKMLPYNSKIVNAFLIRTCIRDLVRVFTGRVPGSLEF